VIACADDNVVRLTPTAKIVATSAFIQFLPVFLRSLVMLGNL